MIVAVEYTPNPRTRKFLPGTHLSSVPREFTARGQSGDKLIDALLDISDVQTVLVNEDAISVTLGDETSWSRLASEIRALIADQISPDFLRSAAATEEIAETDFDEIDATVVATIRDLIDTRIRPAVARDGGDIVFRSFRDGVLGLEMRGACSGCPSSSATLKQGVQNLMRYFVPEVREVIEVA